MIYSSSIYGRFTRFLFPLAVTLIIVEFGIQALSAGMARVPNATETLAAYGVAWGLILLFTSPLIHAKTVSLVLGGSRDACRKILIFVIGLGALLGAGLAALALMPLSVQVIEGLHNVSTELGDTVRFAILWLIPAPLLTGLARFYTGILLRAKRTVTVSVANIASIGAGIGLVLLLLPTPFVQETPIWLPILATHVNLLVELAIVYWGVHRGQEIETFTKPALKPMGVHDRGTADDLAAEEEPLTYGQIFRFIWPLSLNISFQEFSRPLINMFISRGSSGVEALAVITVAYALGQFPYRWLNDMRNLAAAFKDEPGYSEAAVRRSIRWFAAGCGLVSLLMMGALFWTPLTNILLIQLMGLDPDFAQLCVVPLRIFTIFSFVVPLRAYAQGIALVEKRTHIIIYCALPRLAAVWLTLVTLPYVGLFGATLGIAALAAGFAAEAVALWWGAVGYRWLAARRTPLAAT